ncbi:metalloprotease TldD [mine drainage metagenome]|uniref:Metalloprotease TldD n=1 Tax=mine drainage metagenome TaxID=410659 RepID=A0A1J5QWL9_9ZZZZ
MTNPPTTSLLDRANLDRDSVRHQIARGLQGADDGELFLEYSQTEALTFDNGRLKQATYDTSQGFGLRAVKDDAVGYAHSSDVSLPALIRAADAVAAVRGGYSGTFAGAPPHTNVRLYGDENPLDAPGFESKVKLLAEIDAYVRDKDPRVRQVTVSLGATWQVVEILRPDGESYRDIRPLVRVNISVVAGQGDRQESGSKGYGGREGYARFIDTKAWREAADGAIREADVISEEGDIDAELVGKPRRVGACEELLGQRWTVVRRTSLGSDESDPTVVAVGAERGHRLRPGQAGTYHHDRRGPLPATVRRAPVRRGDLRDAHPATVVCAAERRDR